MNSCCSVNSLCIDRKFCVASCKQHEAPTRCIVPQCCEYQKYSIHFVHLSHDTMHPNYFEIDIIGCASKCAAGWHPERTRFREIEPFGVLHVWLPISQALQHKTTTVTLVTGPWIVAGGPMPTNTLHSTQKHKKMKPYI